MTFVLLWVITLSASIYFVFFAGGVTFHHFWHQWEFFSAVSAALYNALIFASVFFLRRRDGQTLDYALGSGVRKLLFSSFDSSFRFCFLPGWGSSYGLIAQPSGLSPIGPQN